MKILHNTPFQQIFNFPYTLTSAFLAVSILSMSPLVLAGEGHDHGEKPAAASSGLPRFTATSEQFELVGVISDKNITLYLDNSISNEPVKNAVLSLELNSKPVTVKPGANGTYEATLSDALKPGVTAVSATFTAGATTDLLAGEIDLHNEVKADAQHTGVLDKLKHQTPWLGAGLVGLIALWLITRRVMRARRRSRSL